MRRKHQRKRIEPSIFQKGSKKNPRRLNRGNSMVRSFIKQKTIESFCMFINLTKKRFGRESKNLKQKRIKSKPIQQKNSIKSNISYPNLKNGKKKRKKKNKKNNVRCPIDAVFTVLPLSLFLSPCPRSHPLSISSPLSFSASLYFIASLYS